jgi:aldose 1-epimerase
MKIIREGVCGQTRSGKPVERYILEDGGLRAAVLTYGGILQNLWVPDRQGNLRDIVLGCDTVADYQAQDKFLGALIGRYANRIERGRFSLNEETYALYCNDGRNHLHGGKKGFDKRIWDAETQADGLHLRLTSPDGEEGYPGTLKTEVVYALADGALLISYWAQTDADTLCNLTNHTYFNLAGHGSGDVLAQEIRLEADLFTPADEESIPHGEAAPVDGTPMDLREFTPIGAQIDADFAQLRFSGGYDHNWVLRGIPGVLHPAAAARCAESGITLTCETTQPGIQFYAGNFLDGSTAGKDGVRYPRRSGFCLETQAFPNSVNCPEYPQAVLHAGETYRHQTIYRFGIE